MYHSDCQILPDTVESIRDSELMLTSKCGACDLRIQSLEHLDAINNENLLRAYKTQYNTQLKTADLNCTHVATVSTQFGCAIVGQAAAVWPPAKPLPSWTHLCLQPELD